MHPLCWSKYCFEHNRPSVKIVYICNSNITFLFLNQSICFLSLHEKRGRTGNVTTTNAEDWRLLFQRNVK